jgi:hypothetical protein
MGRVPRVWDLLDQFKRRCDLRGWWSSKYEDIVRANGEYHSFIWARRVHPKTFRVIASNRLRPIRENDLSYRIVNVSYAAWIFPEKPQGSILLIMSEDQSLRKTTAIYDLSDVYCGGFICLKINETKSVVFHEFESFLKSEYQIDFVSGLPPSPLEEIRQEKERISNLGSAYA